MIPHLQVDDIDVVILLMLPHRTVVGKPFATCRASVADVVTGTA